MIQEVTTHSLTGGLAGGIGGGGAVGAASGQMASVKRRQCVQTADIEYVQPIERTEHLRGRTLDLAGGGAVTVLGLLAFATVYQTWQTDLDDPIGSHQTPTVALATTATLAAGGVAWLSHPWWPRRNAHSSSTERRWTERTYVDATGCDASP